MRDAGGSLVLVGGGARSGKSSFALALAERLGERRIFLATAQALDAEMHERIALHRQSRGAAFRTVEEPLELARALRAVEDADVVVVDCLTLWIANLLLRGERPPAIAICVEEILAIAGEASFHTVLVTNEVGMGIVPDNALAREFRDVVGVAHQVLARAADELYLAVLGVVVRLRPEPVRIERA